MITALLFSITSIAFVYLVQCYYHRKPSFLELGFKREWFRGLAWGHLVGITLVVLPFLLVFMLTENVKVSSAVPETVDALTWMGYYLFFLFMLTLNSFKEELLFRSYPIENLKEKTTGIWTIILSASIIFSIVHHMLEPFTWTAFISRFLFGVFTCQVYIVTRSLWPIIGIHNGSNWFLITFSDAGNWKLGGLLLLTTGVDNQPLEIDSLYFLMSRGVAVIIMYLWMRKWNHSKTIDI